MNRLNGYILSEIERGQGSKLVGMTKYSNRS